MRIVFMGTPQAAVPSLERLVRDGHDIAAVWTQPDRPAGRGRKLTSPPCKEFAEEHGIPVHQPLRLKTAEAAELFRSQNADLAVVVAYGRILPKSFLEAFPHGCINVHFSLLPKYRGAAPVNWAIVRGEDVTGVTTMQMDAGLDTGDILLQKETSIGKEETAVELMERLSHLGAELISDTLTSIDSITPTKQDDAHASLAPLMSKDDGRIDWEMTADEISRRVRGFQPFPRSYTKLEGSKITVWKCKAASPEGGDSNPGIVLSANPEGIDVVCGAGTVLKITELQQEGKRRMTARDFLNGASVPPGSRFGV